MGHIKLFEDFHSDLGVEVGDRVKLISMEDDPDPIEEGTEGTVIHIDDLPQIHVDWDNGRILAIIPGKDRFVKI